MEDPPLSKSKLKKIKREQKWENGRALRKSLRKEKNQARKERKRAAKNEAITIDPNLDSSTVNDSVVDKNDPEVNKRHSRDPVQLPVTIVLDCGFEELMIDKEKKSLSAQVTRCYSDNNKAPFRTHLVLSSFGGHLKERFDNVLSGDYTKWKGVRFIEADFVEAAKQAKDWMKSDLGGKLAGALAPKKDTEHISSEEVPELGEVVYLTSDSPYTLTELKPYSTYIIGGIIDRNRHKGICYKRAESRGMKTARLPIGEYMQMATRWVLTTNHVSEILIRWLELGNWGEAFSRVVPKRKGGLLKSDLESVGRGFEPLATDIVGDDVKAEFEEEGGEKQDGDGDEGPEIISAKHNQNEPGDHEKPETLHDEVRNEKLD